MLPKTIHHIEIPFGRSPPPDSLFAMCRFTHNSVQCPEVSTCLLNGSSVIYDGGSGLLLYLISRLYETLQILS